MDMEGEEVGRGPSCGPWSARGRQGDLAVDVEGGQGLAIDLEGEGRAVG